MNDYSEEMFSISEMMDIHVEDEVYLMFKLIGFSHSLAATKMVLGKF